jgi:hypothetical protein
MPRMFQRNFGRGRPLDAPAAFIHPWPFVLLLFVVPASAWTTSAKASWVDWYDKLQDIAKPHLPACPWVTTSPKMSDFALRT